MSRLEFMRRLVITLLIWNVLLTAGLLISFNSTSETKLNNEICLLEEIPTEELQ